MVFHRLISVAVEPEPAQVLSSLPHYSVKVQLDCSRSGEVEELFLAIVKS
jgi:hypothetical protein